MTDLQWWLLATASDDLLIDVLGRPDEDATLQRIRLMATRRTIRVSEIIRAELCKLIARTRALEGQIITIASVETAPDMKQAFIYVSALETDMPREKIMAELVKHRRDWQKELGQHLKSKFTPMLQFRFDESIERGDRIMEILTELKLPIGDKTAPQPPPVESEDEPERE